MEYNVVCFNQRLTHYREAFFQRSRDRLSSRGIRFELVHGKPRGDALKKNDQGCLDWSYEVTPTVLKVSGLDMSWLSLPGKIYNPDLIILPQENKLLSNYAWLLKRRLGGPKLAFWGHGRNFQTDAPTGFKEKFKKSLVGHVDWWFAYTQMTRDILLSDGFPDERITVLNNAIDNEAFQCDLAAVTDDDLRTLRKLVAVDESKNDFSLGLFCGSLYPDKRIDFMIAAADRIKQRIPGFALVVIGDGPSAAEVKAAALSRPWLVPVGVKKGKEKAAWFKLANIIFNPGAVGLHVLDAFAAGVPMATTIDAKHGPEMAYLVNGENGVVSQASVESYSEDVVNLLVEPDVYGRIRQAGFLDSNKYTLENMVSNFVEGVEGCLSSCKK